MEHRDRSTGWKHAKLSGHKNEECVKIMLESEESFSYDFLKRIGYPDTSIIKTSIGGLHETNVPSVNGKTTKSKTDLKVFLQNGKIINISIKKSLGGQVYLVQADSFINTFERQFSIKIPNEVKRAINLFWANSNDANDIIDKYADKSQEKAYNLQIHHKSLNAATLKNYDETLYKSLLSWFSDNSYQIAKLSFSMGAAINNDDWSTYVWYINLLEENNINEIIKIEDICNKSQLVAKSETYFGSANGGTTIQLPFGFVQWHQKMLQFHHSYNKIVALFNG